MSGMIQVADRDEGRALGASFTYFFALMAGYGIMRPLRDELGIVGGVKNLPWLFTATLVAMLVVVPLYSALVARVARARLIPIIYRFFLLCLVGFVLALRFEVAPVWTARVFFVWLSVYNVFVVSVFWSFMTDLWTPAQGARLFGLIAAGGSAGSIAGSLAVLVLVRPLGPANLLVGAAALLEVAARLATRLGRGAPGSPPAPVGGGVLDGFVHVAATPYLAGIAAQTLLFTATSTFLYLLQSGLVAASGWDRATQAQLFSGEDLVVNLLAAAVQAGVTARVVARAGVRGALALTPVLTAAGFIAVAVAPGLWLVAGFFVVRRVLHFAVDRPAKELLFTVVARDDRYKTKSLIDTAVYRLGDQAGSWLYPLLGALAVPAAVPLALVWLVLNFALARAFAARATPGGPA
jgi:AAA family ATP:ADP antiporter